MNNQKRPWFVQLCVLVMVGVLGSCSMTGEQLAYDELDSTDEDADKRVVLSQLHYEIETTGMGATCSSDIECRTIAVGHRPCGGPEFYHAYAVSTTNLTDLMRMVTRYNKMQNELKISGKEATECYVIQDPGARCDNEHCALNYIP